MPSRRNPHPKYVERNQEWRTSDPRPILDTPCFQTPEIRLAYSCPTGDITSSNGILRIRNLSTTETVNLFSDNGGANPNHVGSLAPDQTFDQSAAASGEFITLGVQGSYVATVQVFSMHRASDNKCHIQAQGLFTR